MHDILTLEGKKFEVFLHKFYAGKYGKQRLGQAFYNEFNLHKLTDQTALHNLYAKDGKQAQNLIKTLFQFT